MATRNYGNFIVHGGQVHAGDTIVNFNISGELTATAHLCHSINASLAKLVDPPACLGDIENEIEEIRNAIDTVQACLDADSQNEALMSSHAQTTLSDLWIACRRHRQTLANFETIVKTSNPDLSSNHAHGKYASLRSALQSLRMRINTSLAILHLSTLQSMRSASEQHWSHIRQRIDNLQEKHTNYTLTRFFASPPVSSTDPLRLQKTRAIASVIHNLLQTKHTAPPSDGNDLQLISGSFSSKRSISFLPLLSAATRPVQRLTSSTTLATTSPDVATFCTSARDSSQVSPDFHLASTHNGASNALISLRNHLDERIDSMLEFQSNRPCQDDVIRTHHNEQGALPQALSIFAELTHVVVITAVIEVIHHVGR